jgi:lysophospholipid acyltransferase (LPLAT)-like uncharacterized protein
VRFPALSPRADAFLFSFFLLPFAGLMQLTAEQMDTSRRTKGERSGTLERAYTFRDLSQYTRRKRLMIRAADLLFYLLIKLIGGSTRFEVEGWEHWETASSDGRIPIYTFWHDHVFLATHFWQRRRIVVMTSQSFDGEYIARFIQRFGYGAARGSSTRGAVGAVVEMVKLMRVGSPTAFTIDGPKGPRHVAKMGAVLLAKKTGHPILPFTITPRRYWAANSWDRFQVPMPFSRALVVIAPPIFVPADAGEDELNARRDELQQALDRINERGEEWREEIQK